MTKQDLKNKIKNNIKIVFSENECVFLTKQAQEKHSITTLEKLESIININKINKDNLFIHCDIKNLMIDNLYLTLNIYISFYFEGLHFNIENTCVLFGEDIQSTENI